MSGKDNEPSKHNFVDFPLKETKASLGGKGDLNEFHSMNEHFN